MILAAAVAGVVELDRLLAGALAGLDAEVEGAGGGPILRSARKLQTDHENPQEGTE